MHLVLIEVLTSRVRVWSLLSNEDTRNDYLPLAVLPSLALPATSSRVDESTCPRSSSNDTVGETLLYSLAYDSGTGSPLLID